MTESSSPKIKLLYARITASVPLLVTVIVHVVLVAVAGYFFVSEQLVAKKKSFEASNASENVTQKLVEHRLQVARKGGGSASASPVAASRIFSVDSNALQLPPPPALDISGASALSGVGFGAGMGGVGGGTGFNTGTGSGNGLGVGFMPMTFLGLTSQKAQKIVFVIDIGPNVLEIKKGGFESFAIIREELLKLVSRLPPSASFGVVLYQEGPWLSGSRGGVVSPYQASLSPATNSNKTQFFGWMKPINLTSERTGFRSVTSRTEWTPRVLPNAGLDPGLDFPNWVQAVRCALEMQPDTIYAIIANPGRPIRILSASELAKVRKIYDDRVKSSGFTAEQVEASRTASYNRANAQLADINSKLKAQGKTPLVSSTFNGMFTPEFQAALKRNGFSMTPDFKGWTDKEGKPIYSDMTLDTEVMPYNEVVKYISLLQRALLKERANLNILLFTGPDEKPQQAMSDLGRVSSNNGGRFQLITNKSLKELVSRNE